jgi:hypothetical protein
MDESRKAMLEIADNYATAAVTLQTSSSFLMSLFAWWRLCG